MVVDVLLHGFVAIVIGREKIFVVVGLAGVHEVLDVLRPHPVQRFRNDLGCFARSVLEVALCDSKFIVKDW